MRPLRLTPDGYDGDADIVDVSAATSLVDRIEAAMRAEEMVESA